MKAEILFLENTADKESNIFTSKGLSAFEGDKDLVILPNYL